jgi:hypothetical protein
MRLFSAKEQAKTKHHAKVFISRTEEMAVIATLHYSGKGGVLYEDSEPVVLSSPLEPKILGQAVLAALRRTTTKQLKDRTWRKLTDWPAYKASKASSVRRFEQSFVGLLVSGANDVNLVYIIEGAPSKDAILHVTSSISSSVPPDEFGERIISVFRACCDRRI